MSWTKFERAVELGEFLEIPRFTMLTVRDIFQELARRGWRWDAASRKWIHQSNHPQEIGQENDTQA